MAAQLSIFFAKTSLVILFAAYEVAALLKQLLKFAGKRYKSPPAFGHHYLFLRYITVIIILNSENVYQTRRNRKS